MGTGYGSAPLALSLVRGQVQRVLVEAGSSVIVLEGALTLRFPFAWLAEHAVAPVLALGESEALSLSSGGWIDLHAADGAEVLILAPASQPLWQRLRRLVEAAGRMRRAEVPASAAAAPVAVHAKGISAYGH